MATHTVAEFDMAVRCAFQYASASLADEQAQATKLQAETYCNAVKASSTGWRLCLELFEYSEHQEVKFYALQAIQEALTKGIADDAVTMQIRSELLAWLRANVAFVEGKAPFLKTKLAVVITVLIKRDYPDRWPTAFHELLALLPMGASMVEMYFRILTAINEEIVEFDATRTQAEAAANMRIKDAMRESSCMADTFDAIYNVLVNCDVSAVMVELSYNALQTLKRYISWVDIGLIVNDRFVPLLFKILRESASLRCPAANCIFEIIDKGMSSEKRLALITQLKLLEILPTLPIQDDDEFAEEVAEIVNGIGLALIECIDEFRHLQNSQLFVQASTMLCQLMPMVWDLFAHETKDVSEEVFEVVNAVGTLIRAEGSAPASDANDIFQPSAYLTQILHGIYRQARYPEDSDSDAAEFEEYRRSLFKIYVNITRKRPLETLNFLTSMSQEMSMQVSEHDSPRDAESFFAMVNRYKEGISALKDKNALEEPSSPLAAIVIRIHSNIVNRATLPRREPIDSSVLLTYYDLSIRYSRVLQNQSQLIPAVLGMMFGENGLTNPHPHVRSRVCYQCLQLVKSIGASVHPHVETILQALLPRLVVPVEAEAVARKNDPTFIPYDDQVYLFELSGQVIASLVVSPETREIKHQYTKMLLEPLIQALNVTLTSVSNGSQPVDLAGDHCANLLNAVANILKAFKSVNAMANQQELFTSVLTAAACVLRVMPAHPKVRSKVVFSLHRFIQILDREHLLGNISETLEHLMVGCSATDVLEVVQLLDQLITRYKEDLFPFFDQYLMPFVQHLCSLMPPRNASADSETKDAPQLEREAIQKYLYTLLLHIVMHNLASVLLSARNRGQLANVLTLLLEGCADVTDTNINRASFTIAHELLSRWAGATPTAELSGEDKTRFSQIMVEQFTPAMFTIAKKYHFEVHDAQCAAVMKEIAKLHEQLVKSFGDEFIRYLRDVCLPGMGCPTEMAASYAAQVATGDRAVILSTYKQLVSRMK
ncbi:hypothetical protein Poli38472_002909 [Pythium oligandrum]|uniref:Exportin-T n=1 Tax=Pythium oligandrum TaxID=41045 RepID=A0A8K1FDJ6_PYTOL|nr:hypothetical protein Poli38472_002909 [Pythium oligandrum]|eukprot:TMW56984.1 hypothetical protein Poli38472_002909 [Pythium oligandrum]